MLGNFFRRSAGRKQRVNKKQNVYFDSPAAGGGYRKYMKDVF